MRMKYVSLFDDKISLVSHLGLILLRPYIYFGYAGTSEYLRELAIGLPIFVLTQASEPSPIVTDRFVCLAFIECLLRWSPLFLTFFFVGTLRTLQKCKLCVLYFIAFGAQVWAVKQNDRYKNSRFLCFGIQMNIILFYHFGFLLTFGV